MHVAFDEAKRHGSVARASTVTVPASHLDWYKNAIGAGRGSEVFRPSGQGGVTLVKAEQLAGFYRRPAAHEFTLQLQLSSGAPGTVDHGDTFSTVTTIDHLVLSPIDVDLAYQVEGDSSFLTAVMPKSMVEAALADGRSPAEAFLPLHTANFADEVITSLMRRLWDHEESGGPYGRLFTDSAWTTIVHSLKLLCEPEHRLTLASAKPAIDWRVRRVLDYLNCNFRKDVGLSEIAAVAGLSQRHTLELFRAGTGLPPHRWVLKRRVEHACELLSDPAKSITSVAYECGFSSSQHFATAFKTHKGATPGRFRRDRLA